MERTGNNARPAGPLVTRRRLLQVAGLAAVPTALAVTPAAARARATTRTRKAAYPPVESFPASTSNYTVADRPNDYSLDYVVIHVTEEYWSDAIGIFQDPSKEVSAHYVVRSEDGHIAQCVDEKDIAWHAGNWDYNTRSIGIEHEGWVDQPSYFTDALYTQSAKLTAAVCAKYGIAVDRDHIIGHSEVPEATHTDPGQYWDWDRYMDLVNQAALGKL